MLVLLAVATLLPEPDLNVHAFGIVCMKTNNNDAVELPTSDENMIMLLCGKVKSNTVNDYPG